MNKQAIFIIGITAFLVGLVVFTRYNRPSSQIIPYSGIIPLPTGKKCTANKVSKTEAVQIMVKAKNEMTIDSSVGYIQVSNISQENSEKIGLAFGVIGQNECGPKVFINFQQGKHL